MEKVIEKIERADCGHRCCNQSHSCGGGRIVRA